MLMCINLSQFRFVNDLDEHIRSLFIQRPTRSLIRLKNSEIIS